MIPFVCAKAWMTLNINPIIQSLNYYNFKKPQYDEGNSISIKVNQIKS